MVKKFYILLVCLPGTLASVNAQDILGKANVRSFFDNYEFSGSAVQTSQTMAGVHLAPELGLSFDNKHSIFVGTDVMHEWGSSNTIDFYDPVIYYEYAGKPLKFYIGSIPRRMILSHYPRMFFADSILNYRPVINGLFWEYRSEQSGSFANVWLDWTGRQTKTRHESFFMGWSGRYNKGIFSFQHLGYMFHFAPVLEPEEYIPVHDNGLMLTSVGVDLSDRTVFDRLETRLGWAVALDRDREIGVWNTPNGLLSETWIEYKGLEIFNTFYKGGRQQVYYNTFSNNLYWGDPVYRSGDYNRTDLSVLFIKTGIVGIKFTYSLHFAERNMYHQQALYATFDLDNLGKKRGKKYKYLWDGWFKQ